MTAAVELANVKGQILVITFPWIRCDNWIGNPEVPVTPRDIESCIFGALDNGWKPEEKGSPFEYVHEEKVQNN